MKLSARWTAWVQHWRGGENEDARTGVEWRIAKILILFRLLHAAQLGIILPPVVSVTTEPPVALLVLAAVTVESAWYVQRLWSQQAYGGGRMVAVELTAAIFLLLAMAPLLPHANRDVLATPMLDLTTEQLTAAALSKTRPARLLSGGAMVVGAYLVLIATGDPTDLGHVDFLVGVTGFIVIPVLIWRGGNYLRTLAADLDQARIELAAESRTLALETERNTVAGELHNHFLNALGTFFDADPDDKEASHRTRGQFSLVRDRLRNYVETGRFSKPVPFLDMLDEQAAQAADEGLTVQRVVPATVRNHPPALPPGHVQALESALRAVLINVWPKAGVNSVVLRVTVADGMLRATVTDHGPGFPAAVLEQGPQAWRSLRRHQAHLRSIGGDLAVFSEPGMTQVLLAVPVSEDEASATAADSGGVA